MEVKEKSMFECMTNLPIHTFEPRHFESDERSREPLGAAMRKVTNAKNIPDKEEQNNDQ